MDLQLKTEWFQEQWITIADHDPERANVLHEALVEIGFPRERFLQFRGADEALAAISEKKCAIFFLDDSIGSAEFRAIHGRLTEKFGANGFFLYAITEGKDPNFTQFAASARIDGIIFRPYERGEFQNRVVETFAVKWPNRYVEDPSGAFPDGAKGDNDFFKRALENERRLGYRDTLTPDPKVVSIVGLKPVDLPGVKQGKASFDRVRLAFRATARNGMELQKAFPIHAMEIDECSATFECSAEDWEAGDHVTIEAEIVHGAESLQLRIEATVRGEAGVGLIAVEFDEGNRTRFEAAIRMVTKRFRELKDFFKYAKGA